MEWLELKIDTSPSGLDAVTELLEQQGVTGVIIDDENDFKDFLEHNRQYWDYVTRSCCGRRRASAASPSIWSGMRRRWTSSHGCASPCPT